MKKFIGFNFIGLSLICLKVYSMSNELEVFCSHDCAHLNSILSKKEISICDLTGARLLIEGLALKSSPGLVQHYRLLYEQRVLSEMMGTDEENRPCFT
jgi:hypothetical protein